jgi:hypothetical protein
MSNLFATLYIYRCGTTLKGSQRVNHYRSRLSGQHWAVRELGGFCLI